MPTFGIELMNTHHSNSINTIDFPATSAQKNKDIVIALHCSGGSARQWRALGESLHPAYDMFTPEHTTLTGSQLRYQKDMAKIEKDAQSSLDIIDQSSARIHLIGHSYGGCVALHVALKRPERIASISLYEPCAFYLLPQMGSIALDAWREVERLANSIKEHCRQGETAAAMAAFINYWSGDGAWNKLKSEHQDKLSTWAPNAVYAFDAIFNELTKPSDFRNLGMPVVLMQGERSPISTQVVSAELRNLLPDCQSHHLSGLGHMGPLTHAETTNNLIRTHILAHTLTQSNLADNDRLTANAVNVAA